LIRIMVEGDDTEIVEQHVNAIARVVEQQVG
jgi:hypothetical protein